MTFFISFLTGFFLCVLYFHAKEQGKKQAFRIVASEVGKTLTPVETQIFMTKLEIAWLMGERHHEKPS